MSPRQAWLRTSIADSTLFSTTIACSGSHLLFLQGMTRPTPEFIHQKLQAIQAINRKLRCPDSAASDNTIMAVAVMALLECLSGTPAACAIHRRGLEHLVRSRGGLRNLGLEGIAARTVSWADTCCAIVLRSKPHFVPDLTLDAGEITIPRAYDGLEETDLRFRLLQLTESVDLSRYIANIWFQLRELSEFLLAIPPGDGSRLDDALFSDKLDSIEREVLHVLHSSTLASNPGVAFLTAFLNASIIYSYQELREIPKFSAICVAVAGRIHSGLEMLDLSAVLEFCPDVFLWTLMLGRSAAPMRGPDRGWFVGIVADLTNLLGVRAREKLEGVQYFDVVRQNRACTVIGSMESTIIEEPGD